MHVLFVVRTNRKKKIVLLVKRKKTSRERYKREQGDGRGYWSSRGDYQLAVIGVVALMIMTLMIMTQQGQ
jgi:hypothetical protein